MLALQAIVQLLLVAAFSAVHLLLWPTLFRPETSGLLRLAMAANWCGLLFFIYSLAHIMHEGAHYHLSRKRWLNELLFCAAGVPVLGSASLFRAVHFKHHGFTNQYEDLELLPQIKAQRQTERRKRRIVMLVLLAGILNGTSYYRQLGKTDSPLDRRTRRRVWLELAIALTLLAALSIWWWLAQGLACWMTGFLAPVLLASWLHGWQELCEHYGMDEGATAEASRSVVPRNPVSKTVYWLLFNFNYHAVHHHWPHVGAHELPSAHQRYAMKLRAKGEAEPPVFEGYTAIVLRHVLPQLVRDFFGRPSAPQDEAPTPESAQAPRQPWRKAA